MLQAPTTETKERSEANQTAAGQEPQRILHPRFGGFDGAPGIRALSGAPKLRQQVAGWQRTIGNQAVLRMLAHSRPTIQTKLTINQLGDQYEQEADRVAEQVMRMPEPVHAGMRAIPDEGNSLRRACACAGSGGECAACKEKREEGLLRRKPAGTSLSERTAPPIVHDVLRSPGHPLDPASRAFFEPRFGQDFSHVRVHTDARASTTASAVDALAYTVGNNVVFATSQYSPTTTAGRRLLAHELTHVVQQSGQAGSAPVSVSCLNVGDVVQRAVSPELDKIEDLLSYGIFDWVITDAEAIEALKLLKQLPKYQQAVFFSDKKYADRLRDNLPDDRIPELDQIAGGAADILPPSATVESIRSELSYSLFDWVVTDAEAIDALEKLKQLSGTQLAVALGAINYGRLLDNLPDSRKQELIDLMAQSLGTGGSREKEEQAHPGTILNSITFQSDHRVAGHAIMKDNQHDWTEGGRPYPKPDWLVNERNETVSRPISHTSDRNVDLDVRLNVLPLTAPSAPITLRGESDVPFLNFDFSGTMSGGLGRTVSLTSMGKIPFSVAEYRNKEVRWTMKWQDWEHEVARTNHTMFVTMFDPLRPEEVTYRRMALAVGIVSPLGLDPHTIVKGIMSRWNSYNLAIYYENPWELADDLEAGAQCITIVRFIQGVIETVGCPGTAEAVTVHARPGAAGVPIEEICPACPGLNVPSVRADHPDWAVALLDDDWHANTFEAALKFNYGGVLRYYPGGVEAVLSTPDQVLHVFKCLAWIKGTGGRDCRIMEVPSGGNYPNGPCPVGSEHTCFVR